MGLDTVELVLEVEEAFGISIPDEEASEIYTVGDLYEFVLERTRDSKGREGVCLTAAAFYSIRRELNGLLRSDSRFRPSDRVESNLPVEHRRELWRSLSQQLELRLPKLSLPGWMDKTCWVIVSLVALACFFGVFFSFGLGWAMFTAILSMGLTCVFLDFATRPFAEVPGPAIADFRGLATNVMALNYDTLSERYNCCSSTDVWLALKTLIVEQLGVNPDKVTKDADFVTDLGAE